MASLADQINDGPMLFALRPFITAALTYSSSGKRRMDLVRLRLLLELGFCFMTVASVPPINDQSSAATVR